MGKPSLAYGFAVLWCLARQRAKVTDGGGARQWGRDKFKQLGLGKHLG